MKPDLPAGTGLALVVLVVLIAASVIGERGGGGEGGGEPVAPSLVALSPLDGRSPREPAGRELRVLVELPRPALADRDDLDALSPEDQREYVKSLEREGAALRSALGARGVELRDAVTFGRTWDGFAATVDTSDLAALSSLGVRAQPVRRFYPATSEPVPVPGATTAAARGARRPRTRRRSRCSTPAPSRPSGYDALERDGDPAPEADPRAPGRRETTGTALAGIVTAAGERVLSVRVAGYGQASTDIHGTTDTLLLGLERSVDPDGDGATDDAVRVALVGVNAPYAGFGDSPEAQAARGAAKLGTLVVAPAGNEGPARPPNGVVGSPGAARSALAAGATEAGAGAARVDVTIGERKLQRAAVLGGAPPKGAPLAGPGRRDGRGEAARERAAPDRPRRARPRRRQPGRPGDRSGRRGRPRRAAGRAAQARAAADARRPRRRPRHRPHGRRREGRARREARRRGDVRPREPGAGARSGRVWRILLRRERLRRDDRACAVLLARPRFRRHPQARPDRPGAAIAPVPGGGAALVAGTAVAAARVAVQAARLARQRPAETAAGLREALVPPSSTEASGAAPAPPVPLGPLRLTRRDGKVSGVRFTLGAFDRGDPLAGGTSLAAGVAARARPRRRRRRGPAAPDPARRRARPAARRVRLHAPPQGAREARRGHLPLPRHGARAPLARGLDGPLAELHGAAVSTVTLYTRPGCHLCDDARAAIERVRERTAFSLVEIDIESDDALHRAYLERIPVVELDGEELFEHFVDEATLAARVRGD